MFYLTMTLTIAVRTKTRTVFNRVNRFLFEGRMEAKKLERARQEKLETKTEIVQKTLLEIIFGCFYAFASAIKLMSDEIST